MTSEELTEIISSLGKLNPSIVEYIDMGALLNHAMDADCINNKNKGEEMGSTHTTPPIKIGSTRIDEETIWLVPTDSKTYLVPADDDIKLQTRRNKAKKLTQERLKVASQTLGTAHNVELPTPLPEITLIPAKPREAHKLIQIAEIILDRVEKRVQDYFNSIGERLSRTFNKLTQWNTNNDK